jgi:signal transduction histidine kinase
MRRQHDGAQQRLIHTLFALTLARQALDDGSEDAAELVEQAIATTENANAELRELARGIHPAILREGGLAPALRTRRAVTTDIRARRVPRRYLGPRPEGGPQSSQPRRSV